jgi:cell division protein FtsB
MHEPLLERIGQLERSVRRWRLACLALALVVVSLLAISGTFGAMSLVASRRMLEEQAMAERDQLDALRQEVMRREQQHQVQLAAERAARKRAEDALKAQRDEP